MRIKKQIGLIFALCFLTNFGFGQSQKSFEKLVSETNEYISQYSKLSPFVEYYEIKGFGLSKKETKEILVEADYDATLTKNKDSIASYHIIGYFQEKIINNIHRLISHNKFKINNIKEQLQSNDIDLALVVSDDKKLYNFSLAEKTGGTYRSQISIMHYTEINQDSLPTQEEIDKGIRISPYTVFEGDGFNNIYSIETKEGTKYVLTGYVRGCSYCFETNVMLVRLEGGIFQQDFVYSINSRSWEEGVYYDPNSQIITVDYVTDDLTTDCDCINNAELDDEQDSYYSDNEETEPINKSCHCTFEFNGLNFELIKESWEKIKE